MISNEYFRRASLLLQTIRNLLDLPHDPKDILSGDLLQLTLTIPSSNQFSKEIWVGCHILETDGGRDRKSTRLNSSHVAISYAVFCLKKKNKTSNRQEAAS